MNVLDGGVVHTACPSRFGIQGGFKHGAEDGGADEAPVKAVTGPLEEEGADFIIYPGYLYVSREHASVDIRECQEFLIFIGVSLFRFLVQDAKQFDKLFTEFASLELRHIVVEHIL